MNSISAQLTGGTGLGRGKSEITGDTACWLKIEKDINLGFFRFSFSMLCRSEVAPDVLLRLSKIFYFSVGYILGAPEVTRA